MNPDDAKMTLRVLELVAQGRLDQRDAQIMSARLEWPRPSNREVARRLGVAETTVRRLVKKWRTLTH